MLPHSMESISVYVSTLYIHSLYITEVLFYRVTMLYVSGLVWKRYKTNALGLDCYVFFAVTHMRTSEPDASISGRDK